MFFTSGVYVCFMILMFVNCHEQFEIGCGAILYKIYYIIIIEIAPVLQLYHIFRLACEYELGEDVVL